MIVAMDGGLRLPALLSQALVAFTIEFDNEFEHRTPHRTTNHGSTPGAVHAPWLVSMVMWSRFLRFVPPLTLVIEARWEDRFGKDETESLRHALRAVAEGLDTGLPGSLPILGYGLFSIACEAAAAAETTLPALLSKVLAFAVEFERDSPVSLAIGANVLRIAGEGPRVRDLPRLAGVSKEAIAMAVSFLARLPESGIFAW